MKSCLLALTAALLLAGCGTTVNTVERAQSQAAPNYIADQRVITDRTLAAAIRVVAINQGTVSGNLLKVQATVENLKNSTKTLNYKFEWTDQNGMAVDSPNETWKQLRIQPRETTTISSVAITPRAADFTLKLKE
jgi:uncharacterized protein YcfL